MPAGSAGKLAAASMNIDVKQTVSLLRARQLASLLLIANLREAGLSLPSKLYLDEATAN
jgi:hypothetical protein